MNIILQQFAGVRSKQKNVRAYSITGPAHLFCGRSNTTGVGLTTAGEHREQQARVNFDSCVWDSTYTDPNYQQPNYTTDLNYTTSCSPPAQSPQLIPMMMLGRNNSWNIVSHRRIQLGRTGID